MLDEEWLEESLLKKLERDDEPEPPLPPEELLLLLHAVLVCTAGSVLGGEGSRRGPGWEERALRLAT